MKNNLSADNLAEGFAPVYFVFWPEIFGGMPPDKGDVSFPKAKEVVWGKDHRGKVYINASCTLGESGSQFLGAGLLAHCIVSGRAIPLCSETKVDPYHLVKFGYMRSQRVNATESHPAVYLLWLTQKGVDTLTGKVMANPNL